MTVASSKKWGFVVVIGLFMGMAALQSTAQPQRPSRGPDTPTDAVAQDPPPRTIQKGTLIKVDGKTLVLSQRVPAPEAGAALPPGGQGARDKVVTDDTTPFWVNGQIATLDDLKPGMSIRVMQRPGPAGDRIMVTAFSPAPPAAEIAAADQILAKQEEVLRQVPLYSEARAQVEADLAKQADLKTMTAEQLSLKGTKLLDEFWSKDGDFSAPAHTLAYQARVLLELAHQKAPDDLKIADQLVEAVQAYPLVYKDRSDRAKQRFRENNSELLAVRKAQLDQVQKELAAGRKPDWADFVRAYDYAWLVQWSDSQAAQTTLKWLEAQMGKGNWSFYRETVADWQASLTRGTPSSANIYVSSQPMSFPGEYRFGHRSMGYVGPRAQERGIVLAGQASQVDPVHLPEVQVPVAPRP